MNPLPGLSLGLLHRIAGQTAHDRRGGDETDLNLTMDFNMVVPTDDNWATSTLISGALPETFAANNGLATADNSSFVKDTDDGCPGAAANLSRVYVPVTNGTKNWFKLSKYSVNYGFLYSFEIKWVTTPRERSTPERQPDPLQGRDGDQRRFERSLGRLPHS